MSNQEIDTQLLRQLLEKHTPSNLHLLLHCCFSFVVCLGVAMFYAFNVIEVPIEITASQEEDYRFQIGIGYGLLITIVPWVYLIGRYIYDLTQVRKRAKAEYIELTLNNGGNNKD